MKTIVASLLSILIFVLCESAFSENDTSKVSEKSLSASSINTLDKKYTKESILKVVYHLNEREKARMLIESVNELMSANDNIVISVVIHGPAIVRLAKSDGMSDDFKSLLNRGVNIGACSNSILKRRVDPNTMIDGVEFVVEGGIKRIVLLQQQGYIYIKI